MYQYGSDFSKYPEPRCKWDPYVGLDGKPVKRTPEEYPYQFYPYVWWKGDYDEDRGIIVDSDRLKQINADKYKAASNAVWGTDSPIFEQYNIENENVHLDDLEAFISCYVGEWIKLTAVVICCNFATGYRVFRFIYEKNKDKCKISTTK